MLWTFHTIPREGEFGNDTWEDDSWRTTGNGGVWSWMSADPELGLVYLPTEAGTGDYYGGHRPGDNLFTQSIVALDVATGERRWHYQTVHHGIWDYDLPTAPVLLDLTVDGREIPALAQVTKQAFTFVLDRRTGEPVWPLEERPMPASSVPGEKTAPTQPFPTKPPPFQRQGVSEDDLLDLTPELKEEALRIARFYTLGPLFTPPTVMEPRGNRGTLTVPGALGGANWPSVAADPETGVVYVSSGLDVNVLGLENDPERSTMNFVQGQRRNIRLPEGGGPAGAAAVEAALGTHHRPRPEPRRNPLADPEQRYAEVGPGAPGARRGRIGPDRPIRPGRPAGDQDAALSPARAPACSPRSARAAHVPSPRQGDRRDSLGVRACRRTSPEPP